MKSIATMLLLVAGVASASDWSLKTSTDSMTDETRKQASITNQDGDRFTVIRRSDNSVWGYIQLADGKMFNVGERLMLRVDKNKAVSFNEDFEKLTKKLGKPMEAWEWNPNLIGFRMWHGDPAEGCGLIKQLYDGSQLIIRYHPNDSTERDVTFDLSGNSQAITQALDFQISSCQVK